jgi:hypothetical protein
MAEKQKGYYKQTNFANSIHKSALHTLSNIFQGLFKIRRAQGCKQLQWPCFIPPVCSLWTASDIPHFSPCHPISQHIQTPYHSLKFIFGPRTSEDLKVDHFWTDTAIPRNHLRGRTVVEVGRAGLKGSSTRCGLESPISLLWDRIHGNSSPNGHEWECLLSLGPLRRPNQMS